MASKVPASLRQHVAALRLILAMTVGLGLAYPLAVTAIGQGFFSHQADGSLLRVNGSTVGSALIGQSFVDSAGDPLPQYFQPRPSAAGDGYDPTSSGASNLGPENTALVKAIKDRRGAAAAFNGVPAGAVPPDALTASGSGLDPNISPDYAYLQVSRVAATRGLDAGEVRALVTRSIVGRDLGFIGAELVNVLRLNVALDQLTS